jgi:2-polyprenyl-3-methyl-5-hydroxy-6-metoxy-1,4-benzoquinol methylase
MITQAEFFDSYADRWDSMERPDIGDLLDRVVTEAGVGPGMDILDVGTGTGVIIPSLLRAMGGRGGIRAIDVSSGMLRVARGKEFPDCVEFELADVESFECPQSAYDIVICNAVFPHFVDKPAALLRVCPMLKPGGRIVISHPTGREAVNRVHREAGSVVAEDRVPDPLRMRAMLEAAGFVEVSVTDEPEFYVAIGTRPRTPGGHGHETDSTPAEGGV